MLHVHRPAKTLFVRFSSLGDILLAEPAVRAYRSLRPGSSISFLTKEAYRDLVSIFPAVDEVISAGSGRLTLARLIGLSKSLRKEGYQTLVDLHRNTRSKIVSLFLGAPERTAYRKDSLRRRLMPRGFFRGGVEHTARRYIFCLEKFGLRDPDIDVRPRIEVGETLLDRARTRLKELGWDGERPLVILCPGAKWPVKRWPADHFAGLIEVLEAEVRAWCLLVGDGDDREASTEVENRLSAVCADLTGRTTLTELAALFRLARLAVSNDSGPMHLAVAVGTPVMAVFGPTTPSLGFAPLGERDKVFQVGLDCRPCSIHGSRECRLGDRPCLTRILPEEIAGEAIAILKEVGR